MTDPAALSRMQDAGALSGLHDIVVPEPVGYMPQTIGWAVVLVISIGLAVWMAVLLRRRRRARRYRELALSELETLRRRFLQVPGQDLAGQDPSGEDSSGQDGARQDVVAALPELVKRTALMAFPRPEVASLSGEAWLEFLDRSYGGTGFTDGPGRRLPDLAYAGAAGRPCPGDDDVDRLVSLVGTWIRDHDAAAALVDTDRRGG